MKSWTRIDGALGDYVDANWLRESPLKRRLREETAKKTPIPAMQISAHQGQQIALLAVRQRRASIAQNTSPQHVSTEYLPFFGIEVFSRDYRIGEQLPRAFMVEVAGQRRDHPVLMKQQAHGVDVHAVLAFQTDQVAHLVVAALERSSRPPVQLL